MKCIKFVLLKKIHSSQAITFLIFPILMNVTEINGTQWCLIICYNLFFGSELFVTIEIAVRLVQEAVSV